MIDVILIPVILIPVILIPVIPIPDSLGSEYIPYFGPLVSTVGTTNLRYGSAPCTDNVWADGGDGTCIGQGHEGEGHLEVR